jgi:hypothetical protein
MFDFLPVLPKVSGNSIACCVDASVTAILQKNEQQPISALLFALVWFQ